jgi:large subunit ribosomal protein L23
MLSEKTYKQILSPLISEKSVIQKSESNTYVFKVNKDATKTEIKKATEEIFGVVVKSIRVLNTKFKNKRTRFGKYKTKTFKKAYIKLEEGKEINLENPFK